MKQESLFGDLPTKKARPKIKQAGLRQGQSWRILERLRRGPATNVELSQISLKYTSRISDLRHCGHQIECQQVEGGLTRYTLKEGK